MFLLFFLRVPCFQSEHVYVWLWSFGKSPSWVKYISAVHIDTLAQFEFDIQQQPLRDVDFSRLGQLAAVRQNDVLSATGNRDAIVLTLA